MPAMEAVPIIDELERQPAPQGTEARIIRRFGDIRSDGQSNGDVLVAIIDKGTVVTVYWRRATQTFSAEGFKVDRFVDATRTPEQVERGEQVELTRAVHKLAHKWGAQVRPEGRS
jgi:hypothetical protein